MTEDEDPTGTEAETEASPGPAERPAETRPGPYPGLLHYQMLTPTAPLAVGAASRVFPLPMGPPPSATVPAAWAPDPTGRHQWRWWSGAAWTDHVADGDEVSEDPLEPA